MAGFGIDALVVVVHSDSEHFLGSFLSHNVLIQMGLDVLGFGHQGSRCLIILPLEFFGDDLVAKFNALVTDVQEGPAMSLRTSF